MLSNITAPSGKRVGILGGSFNPAHDGHLHISQLALECLALDTVWWLVSPQNPLKPVSGMMAFEDRILAAEQVAQPEPRIVVSDAEAKLSTRFTADTLPQLVALFPDVQFVWIMGADNLIQIDQWEDWQSIFSTLPIAAFARPPYSDSMLACKAVERFAESQVEQARGVELADMPPPAWIYFDTPLHPESATRIRSRRESENMTG